MRKRPLLAMLRRFLFELPVCAAVFTSSTGPRQNHVMIQQVESIRFADQFGTSQSDCGARINLADQSI